MTTDSSPAPPGNVTLPNEMHVAPSPRPLKIAFVYSRPPLPMRRADQMTVAHLLAFLAARGHTVDFWTLDDGEPVTDAQHAWLASQCRHAGVLRQGLWQKAGGLLQGLVRGLPLQCGLFTNAAQRTAVQRALEENDYDVAYAYLIRSAEVLRGHGVRLGEGARQRPVTYLAMQVSQALNTRRIADHSKRLRDRLIYRLEYLLTRTYEARVWENFTRVVLIGPKDVEEVQSICRRYGRAVIDNYVYGPHGVDVERFAPKDEDVVEPATVIYSGVLRTNTNIDAISWFVHEIWPKVRRLEPAARLLVVGREPAADVVRLGQRPGVEVVGEVPEIGAYIARAAVCINPMRACAGQQNKLLEYLAAGKAVVATSCANEGIGAMPGRDLVIADDPKSFAEEVAALLRDRKRRARLGASARRFIEDHWTWEALFLQLEQSFYDALDGKPGPGEPAAGDAVPPA